LSEALATPTIERSIWTPDNELGLPTELPAGVTNYVKAVLWIAGLLPKDASRGSTWYNSLGWIASIMHCVFLVRSIIMGLETIRDSFGLVLLCTCVLILQVAVFTPAGPVFAKEFASHGAIMAMMHHMGKRGFAWHRLRCSIHVFAALVVMFNLTLSALHISSFAMGGTVTQVLWRDPDHEKNVLLPMASLMCDALGITAQLLCVLRAFSFIWVVHLCCTLHKHDLLCYAGAVATALERDNHPGDIVVALQKLECTVASRLRHASATWVRFTVYVLALMWIISTIIAMSLLAIPNFGTGTIAWCTLVCTTCLAAGTLMGFPLASVAETFEYDVLLALNHPVVLNKAQRYFGQQLLSHLHTLEWGFRFGGTVISTKFVTSVAAALIITMSSAVSQALLSKLSIQTS